jgi:hypothetical protein
MYLLNVMYTSINRCYHFLSTQIHNFAVQLDTTYLRQ